MDDLSIIDRFTETFSRAAASLTGRVGAAYEAGGPAGVARTLTTAPASRLIAGRTAPILDAYREGAAQGYRDAGPPAGTGPGGGPIGGGPGPGSGPSPGGGGGAPGWARSLARRQRLTQAGLIAAGAVREATAGRSAPVRISRTRAEEDFHDVQACHLALRRDARAGHPLPEGRPGLGRAHRLGPRPGAQLAADGAGLARAVAAACRPSPLDRPLGHDHPLRRRGRSKGGARAVGPAVETYKPSDAQIAFHLARFVDNVRSLSIDPVVVRQSWLTAYDFVTDKAAVTLNEYARRTTRSPRSAAKASPWRWQASCAPPTPRSRCAGRSRPSRAARSRTRSA